MIDKKLMQELERVRKPKRPKRDFSDRVETFLWLHFGIEYENWLSYLVVIIGLWAFASMQTL